MAVDPSTFPALAGTVWRRAVRGRLYSSTSSAKVVSVRNLDTGERLRVVDIDEDDTDSVRGLSVASGAIHVLRGPGRVTPEITSFDLTTAAKGVPRRRARGRRRTLRLGVDELC